MPPPLVAPPVLNTEKKRPHKALKIEIVMFILMHVTGETFRLSLRIHLLFLYPQFFFPLNYSLHSILFCIGFRWTAQWPDSHRLRVVPLLPQPPPGPIQSLEDMIDHIPHAAMRISVTSLQQPTWAFHCLLLRTILTQGPFPQTLSGTEWVVVISWVAFPDSP